MHNFRIKEVNQFNIIRVNSKIGLPITISDSGSSLNFTIPAHIGLTHFHHSREYRNRAQLHDSRAYRNPPQFRHSRVGGNPGW